jgi:hypothetical protein
MSRGAIEITIFVAPERMPRIPPRLVTAFIGATLSLALHVLVFTGAIWGAGSTSSRPPAHLADAATDTPDQDDAAMQWIVLDSSTPSDRTEKHAVLSIADPSVLKLSADALADLSAVSHIVVDSSDVQAQQNPADDSDKRSALYGRYVGQINARIFRAWLRPRTPIGSPSFSCRAHIDQDAVGNVKEVTLEGCNGGVRWQLSVVHAIQSSSPLPAPPDPRVFRHAVTVSFQSLGYGTGANENEFEPATAQLAETGGVARRGDDISMISSQGGILLHIVGHAAPSQLPPIEPEPGANATEVEQISGDR